MITDLLNTQIGRAARQHGLPVALVTAIVRVESEGNPWAMRYESAFYDRYIASTHVQGRAPCSDLTEARARATSYGLMQIMGAVARERGFDQPFLSELCDPDVGLEFGCRQLASLSQRYISQYGWAGVVAAYNAGSPRQTTDGEWVNQSYVDKVRKEGGLG